MVVILKKLAVTVYMSCRKLIVTLFQNLTVYEIIIIDLYCDGLLLEKLSQETPVPLTATTTTTTTTTNDTITRLSLKLVNCRRQ